MTADPKPPSEDVVLLSGPTADGAGIRVLRARDGRIEAGEVRPLEEGKPLAGDVVTLKARTGAPRVCDVEVHYASKPRALATAAAAENVGSGPRQVASDAYREQWQKIFGNRALS